MVKWGQTASRETLFSCLVFFMRRKRRSARDGRGTGGGRALGPPPSLDTSLLHGPTPRQERQREVAPHHHPHHYPHHDRPTRNVRAEP
jgi:hypothetical protein